MALSNWRKVENESGYPCYVDESTGRQSPDHPQFQTVMESLAEYNGIKYMVYRISYKIFALQRQLRVPPLRITSGVFARHQLSLSESSLSLEPAELESVLADIYFAAEKEGLYNGDVDLAVDLVINLLLNVYDRDRNQPTRVLAAKTLLILLSEESSSDKWHALANCSADHNGCVSPRRLATLLTYITTFARYLEDKEVNSLQGDVDACFEKNAGMLGLSSMSVAEWAVVHCSSTQWLPVLSRINASRTSAAVGPKCAACSKPIVQMLKFKCTKCSLTFFCEKCYLYDKDLTSVRGHKNMHVVQEIIDEEGNPSECLSFMNGMRRFFFCTRTKKKKMKTKKNIKKPDPPKVAEANGTLKLKKEGRPAMFTSTVGKASGNNARNPTNMLQDIIAQLESHNKAMYEASSGLQNLGVEGGAKTLVEAHWNQISAQINRLKILEKTLTENSTSQPTDSIKSKEKNPIQAFDLFSPIPVVEEEKQSKVTEDMKNRPRMLSLDSGNYSEVSKRNDSQKSDGVKPPCQVTSSSISTVSMGDISSWYNTEADGQTKHLPMPGSKPDPPLEMTDGHPDYTNDSLCISEQKFDADLRSVASSNDKMKELNADLDTVLDRLQQILSHNFAMDDSCFDNSQLRETANEMEGLLGTLIRGVEQRATLNANKGLV